jgi:hypothetical protein
VHPDELSIKGAVKASLAAKPRLSVDKIRSGSGYDIDDRFLIHTMPLLDVLFSQGD